MFSISIGHNVNGTPTHTHEDVMRVFRGCMNAHGIEGYSAWQVDGCYKGELETSTRIELFDDVEDLGGLLNELCNALEQEKIYANEYAPARFVEGIRAAA